MPGNDLRHTFIPKKATLTQTTGSVQGRSFGLFFGLSLIIFLLTVFASAGAYAYRAYLGERVSGLNTSLERAKAAFEPETILALKRFSARTNTADALLGKHLAPSIFFTVLEDLTVKSIRFSKFTYSFDGGTPEATVSGTARNYSSVALQSDIFSKSPYIKNPVFSNLNLDKSGNVTFDVTVELDPALIVYKETTARSSEPTPAITQ